MILHENGVFCLQNGSFSYLFRVAEGGWLEHIHFGAPVRLSDADALGCKYGLWWGCATFYTDGKTCLDAVPQEWSGSGRGDYRESPVSWSLDGKSQPSDFTYKAHRIIEGIAPMECGLPQARGAAQTLAIDMEHPGGLRLTLYYTLFDTVLTRRAVLENGTEHPVTLHKLMSFCADLPGSYEMRTFDGAWNAEMRPTVTRVGAAKVVHDSVTGFSSHRHQPGFLLCEEGVGEDHGRAYGFNLVYSGNHYACVQRSFQGLTRVMQGINPSDFSKELSPGARFETPEAVLTWSDRGMNGISCQFHSFVNKNIIPSYWQFRDRPVLYNDWEGCMFDFHKKRLVDLAKTARDLGCELFVLDDGWFGDRNSDTAGLGDYRVNTKKLPGGLDALAKEINALGMEFGLWFEPEAVNPDSDLYRAHPDWALTDALPPVLQRNELLLDLTRQEVRDYIVENVSAVLDSANITYVKWDMNRHSIALGARAHDYILGLYEILGRIFTPRPHILLESCSSGGNRFDLGMLCYSPQVWCSDDTDAIERLTIQQGLSYLYPQSTFGAHVSAAPHSQTLRNTPLATRGNVSFFGLLGYELDLKHLLPVEKKEIKAQIAFYKEHRRCFQFGSFRRLCAQEGTAWQVSSGKTHIAGLFHTLQSAAPGYEWLRMQALQPDKQYTFVSREQSLRLGQFGELVKFIAPTAVSPHGVLLRTADHHYAMPDGGQQLTASGSALLSGVCLSPRFIGAGYDPKARNQGDFSSNVYVVEEVVSNG